MSGKRAHTDASAVAATRRRTSSVGQPLALPLCTPFCVIPRSLTRPVLLTVTRERGLWEGDRAAVHMAGQRGMLRWCGARHHATKSAQGWGDGMIVRCCVASRRSSSHGQWVWGAARHVDRAGERRLTKGFTLCRSALRRHSTQPCLAVSCTSTAHTHTLSVYTDRHFPTRNTCDTPRWGVQYAAHSREWGGLALLGLVSLQRHT